ncbi:MAG TPA: helix-turn-helix transcriptional regulator [Cytophagaceae bacterium]|jgi:transcriptional regulator with XRE-family HTH domain
MNLGTTIKNLRKKQGFTQEYFANKCGITQTYLSQIENNLKEPNLSKLKEISESLQVPLPIIFFLSLDENDVQPEKREAFKMVNPSVKSFVDEFFKA